MLLLLACTGAPPPSVPSVAAPQEASVPPPAAPPTAPPCPPADLAAAPRGLYRVVWLDEAWRAPPGSGTLPEIEIDPAVKVVIHRTGAGEARWDVREACRDGETWTLRGATEELTLTPWAGAHPPPPPAWSARYGNEGPDASIAWVTTPRP